MCIDNLTCTRKPRCRLDARNHTLYVVTRRLLRHIAEHHHAVEALGHVAARAHKAPPKHVEHTACQRRAKTHRSDWSTDVSVGCDVRLASRARHTSIGVSKNTRHTWSDAPRSARTSAASRSHSARCRRSMFVRSISTCFPAASASRAHASTRCRVRSSS